MPHLPLCASLGMLVVAAGACVAAEKLDLDRVKPVPSDQPIPVQDFFRPALLNRPELNDSGTHVAGIVPLGPDKTGMVVIALDKADAKPQVLAIPGELNVDSLTWLTDDRILYWASALETGELNVSVAEVNKGLANHAVIEGVGTRFVGVPDARRDRPLLMMLWDIADGHGRKGHVVEVDTVLDLTLTLDYDLAGGAYRGPQMRNRNDRRITNTFPDIGTLLETAYFSDKVGELAFGFTAENGVSKLHYFTGGAWKESPANLDDIEIVTCGERPGEVIVRGPRREGKPRALQFMDAAGATLGDVLLEDPGYDVHGTVVRDPRTHQLLGVAFDRSCPAMTWFTEEYRSVQKFLDTNFPGKVVRTWPADTTGNNFFLQVFSDRQPVQYFRANLQARTLGLIRNTAPWIEPERMQPMTMMKFKTAEGARLDAYVTLPAGASKEKPVPMVVLPHGGPWTRDTWGFDPEAQFFASRGFAVLQPNYRGSIGTDWMFPYEERWAFRKMHDDVSAATRAVLKTGLIDPERIAIVGSSFGGYLAVSGAVHDPALYRCAVTVSGIFDREERIQELRLGRFDDPEYGNLIRWLGNPKDAPEKFRELSPGRFVERARGPVLVAYDKDDRAITVNESRRLIDSLKKHNVPHEVVTATGERPGWGHFGEKVELYGRIVSFLQKSMPARAGGSAK